MKKEAPTIQIHCPTLSVDTVVLLSYELNCVGKKLRKA